MRAKQVNEVQKFERGQSPKTAMGIGGVDLTEMYDEKLDEFKKRFNQLAMRYTDEFKNDLVDMFVGKTITAEMSSMPKINKQGKTVGSFERGNFTIKVQDILPSYPTGDGFEIHISGSPLSKSYPTIIVADDKGNMYQMDMSQNIKID